MDGATPPATAPIVGMATSRGNREFNCDVAADYWFAGNRVHAAAVVDGTGNSFEVAHTAFLAAHTAVRVGARKGAVPGLLAATELIADPTVEFPAPDGVMALAVCRPTEPTVIVWVGDVAAFAFDVDATGLRKITEDHTKGQRMRLHGEPEDEAAKRDRFVINSIGRATVGAIALAETLAKTTLLCSDGVHRFLSLGAMATIVRKHHDEPTVCAEALVEAARSAGSGDDAAAVVLTRPAPPDVDGASLGR